MSDLTPERTIESAALEQRCHNILSGLPEGALEEAHELLSDLRGFHTEPKQPLPYGPVVTYQNVILGEARVSAGITYDADESRLTGVAGMEAEERLHRAKLGW